LRENNSGVPMLPTNAGARGSNKVARHLRLQERQRGAHDMSTTHSIEHHPDILALKASYERASESMAAQATFGLALLTAVYAAISPWVVGFNATAPRITVNDLIVGIAAAVIAIGFGSALERTHGLTWTLPVMGVWLIVSPWVIAPMGPAPSNGLIASNVVAGGLLTLFGLGAAFFGMRGRQLAAR
jgi:SPW repeat